MTLRPYQKQAVKKILRAFQKNKGFLLADETGLGKTIQALEVARLLCDKDKQFVLIICPAFLKPNWQEKIMQFCGEPTLRSYTFFIYSYNDLSNLDTLKFVMRRKYALAIIDECHYAKDFNSKRTQVVYHDKGVLGVCNKVLSMSATPFKNRVGEIYPFLYAIRHKIVKDKTQEMFIKEYAGEYRELKLGKFRNKKVLTHKGVSNRIFELKDGIKEIFLRRKKADVLKDLPDAQRIEIPIDCTDSIIKKEKKLLGELMTLAGHSDFDADYYLDNYKDFELLLNTVPSFTELVEFKKQIGLLKMPAILEHLRENVLPEKNKFMLLCYYTETAKKYVDELEKLDVKNIVLVTGKVNVKKRFEIVKNADQADECVFIATMNSIKEGLDFIGFDTIFFAETDWSPDLLEQCEGRIHRYGQKEKVFWYYFIMNRGIEKAIYKTLNEKKETIEKLIS
jgi:SNF2 family DNA or RNA helicase